MPNIPVTLAVKTLLDADDAIASKAALTTLGVGTAGFLNTGVVAGTVPVLLAGGKLPILDGSNLTGIAEFEELHPTRLVLNDLSGVAAEAGTLAYNGPNLAKHDGTTVGGVVIAGGSGGGGREGFYEEYRDANYLQDKACHEVLVFSQQVSFLPVQTVGVFGLVNVSVYGDSEDNNTTDNYIYILSASTSTTVTNRPLLSADFSTESATRHILLHTGFSSVNDNFHGWPEIVAPNIPLCDVINFTGLFGNGSSAVSKFEGKSWNPTTLTNASYEFRNKNSVMPPLITTDEGLLSIYFTIIHKNAILHGPVYPTAPFHGAMWFNTTTSLLEKFNGDNGTFESYTPSGGLLVENTYTFRTVLLGQIYIARNQNDRYYTNVGGVQKIIFNFGGGNFRTLCNAYFPS
jgi:hypothetical protein